MTVTLIAQYGGSMARTKWWTVAPAFTLALVVAAPQAAVAAPVPVEAVVASVPAAVPPVTRGPVSDDDLDRLLCQDLADYDSDAGVRAAARAALDTNDPAQVRDFLDNGLPVYRQAATERAKDIAAANRAQVTTWAQTGGPVVRQKGLRKAAEHATG